MIERARERVTRGPRTAGTPTAALQAEELHSLLEGARIEPPYVLVPHSYGGLITRVYADRYPDDIAGLVFEDVSTAWEIDLWPKWDDSPWIDGGRKVDIQATEEQVPTPPRSAISPPSSFHRQPMRGRGSLGGRLPSSRGSKRGWQSWGTTRSIFVQTAPDTSSMKSARASW